MGKLSEADKTAIKAAYNETSLSMSSILFLVASKYIEPQHTIAERLAILAEAREAIQDALHE